MQQSQTGFNTTETEFFLENSVSIRALHFLYKPNTNMDKLHEISVNNSVILYFPQTR